MSNAITEQAPLQLLKQMGLDEAQQWKLIKLPPAGPEQLQELHANELAGEKLEWASHYNCDLDTELDY